MKKKVAPWIPRLIIIALLIAYPIARCTSVRLALWYAGLYGGRVTVVDEYSTSIAGTERLVAAESDRNPYPTMVVLLTRNKIGFWKVDWKSTTRGDRRAMIVTSYENPFTGHFEGGIGYYGTDRTGQIELPSDLDPKFRLKTMWQEGNRYWVLLTQVLSSGEDPAPELFEYWESQSVISPTS